MWVASISKGGKLLFEQNISQQIVIHAEWLLNYSRAHCWPSGCFAIGKYRDHLVTPVSNPWRGLGLFGAGEIAEQNTDNYHLPRRIVTKWRSAVMDDGSLGARPDIGGK